jgi:thymidylate synthase
MLGQNTPFAEKCERAKPLLQPAFQLQKKYEEYAVQSPSFAEAAGSLGPVYGAVWRGKNGGGTVDQIAAIEADLRNGGKSRRNICTAFKPELLPEQALPPCHYDFQVLTRPQSNKLDVIMNQRSADSVLGVIHNIPQYGIITQLLAETHGFELGKLRINFGDLHIYLPHVPLVEEELLKREEKPNNTRLVIKNRKDSITEYEPEDFEPIKETGYAPHPALTYRIPMFGGLF